MQYGYNEKPDRQRRREKMKAKGKERKLVKTNAAATAAIAAAVTAPTTIPTTIMPSMPWRSWLGDRNGIRPLKTSASKLLRTVPQQLMQVSTLSVQSRSFSRPMKMLMIRTNEDDYLSYVWLYCTLKIHVHKYVWITKQHLKNKVPVEPINWWRWGW